MTLYRLRDGSKGTELQALKEAVAEITKRRDELTTRLEVHEARIKKLETDKS